MQNMPDSLQQKHLKENGNTLVASSIIHTGFIAQDVERTAKGLNYNFDGVNAPTNPTDNYSLAYGQFVVPLVKAVQEQQKIIEEQNKKIDLLMQAVELLKQKIK